MSSQEKAVMKNLSTIFQTSIYSCQSNLPVNEGTNRTINSSPAPGGYGYRCKADEGYRVVRGFRVRYGDQSRHLTPRRPRIDYEDYQEHYFVCEGSLFNGVVQMTHRGHCSPTREERVEKYVLKIEKGEKVNSGIIAKDLNIHVRKVGHVLSYLDCVERQFTRDRQHAIWVRV